MSEVRAGTSVCIASQEGSGHLTQLSGGMHLYLEKLLTLQWDRMTKDLHFQIRGPELLLWISLPSVFGGLLEPDSQGRDLG